VLEFPDACFAERPFVAPAGSFAYQIAGAGLPLDRLSLASLASRAGPAPTAPGIALLRGGRVDPSSTPHSSFSNQ